MPKIERCINHSSLAVGQGHWLEGWVHHVACSPVRQQCALHLTTSKLRSLH